MRRIYEHLEARLPEYLIGLFVVVLSMSVGVLWFAFQLYTDIQLMKCKMGISDGIEICQWVPTIVEDIAKVTEGDED